MRKLWVLFTALLASLFGSCGKDRPPARVPLDVQMQSFERIGIKLNPGITMDDLLNIWPIETLESEPYDSLYAAFGGSRELEGRVHFTDQIWYFDTESLIEGVEYERLLKNIGRISGGELKYENIKVSYLENDTDPVVNITFDLNGAPAKWRIHPFTDWDTATFLSPINEYARSRGLKGRLVWNRSWGEDWALGWHTPEQIEELRKLGVDIAEVTPDVTARPYPKQR